jgi:hypothetical protein
MHRRKMVSPHHGLAVKFYAIRTPPYGPRKIAYPVEPERTIAAVRFFPLLVASVLVFLLSFFNRLRKIPATESSGSGSAIITAAAHESSSCRWVPLRRCSLGSKS